MKSIDLVIKVLEKGFVTQQEIQQVTQLSQATVSRCLKKLRGSLLILPNCSPAKYALPGIVLETNLPFDLAEVDEHGKESYLGFVHYLFGGKFFVNLNRSASKLYLGESKNGVYDGLPYFLDDLRPQGFLGNQIAKQLSNISSDYPKKLNDWNSKHILQYLVEYGDDLPGNIKFGDGVVKAIRQPVQPIGTDTYDFMCRQIESGSVPQSSAAGEQQKFTAFNKEVNAHVLVKYTSNQNDAVTRRWKDILVTEYHALKTLADFEIPAAEVRLIDQDNRYYLETKRFDRLGNYGRSSMLSLQVIDLEFIGLGENWKSIAQEMSKKKILGETDHFYVSFLWEFSKWIGNSDTHLGNISFGIKGGLFSLLPIYDMCTMSIAPSINSLKPINVLLPNLSCLSKGFDSTLIKAVATFWQRVEKDSRISNEFSDYLKTQKISSKIENYKKFID
ncbi:MAG: HipA domain-containing protein [Marinicella sp.]